MTFTGKMSDIFRNNGGQALLFVVVALTISMVVGVSVATRTLSVSKRVSTTDTQARVYYAAEAGIERFVALTMSELLAVSNKNGCGSTGATRSPGRNCEFPLGGDIITNTNVDVTAISYNESEPSNHYSVNAKNGTFSGIALSGYTGGQVTICWISNNPSAVFYSLWNSAALIAKNILAPNGWVNGSGMNLTQPVMANDVVKPTYSSCKAVTTPNTSYMLYVMPLGDNAKIGIFPGSTDLPLQGFRITSKATLQQGAPQVQVTKVIETIRSYNHVPGFFDSLIYTQGGIIAN